MPLLVEKYEYFKRGAHRAAEVDADRLDEVIEAVGFAHSFGKAGPIVELVNEHSSDDIEHDEDEFFTSDDGYPVAYYLHHHILTICCVDDAEPFGLGIFGAIFGGNLLVGDTLVDEEAPVSPEWLEVDPWMPYHHAPAKRLLAEIDFEAGIDEDAISDVNEVYDMGGLTMDSGDVSDFQIADTPDEWHRELVVRLREFRDELEAIANRKGHVLSWYDDNPTL